MDEILLHCYSLAKKGRKAKKDKDRETKLAVTTKASPSASGDRLTAAKPEVAARSRPPSGKLTAANLSVMLERSESQGSSGDEVQLNQKRSVAHTSDTL